MPDSLLEPEYATAYNTWKADSSPESNAAVLKTLHPVIEGAVRTHTGQVNPLAMSQAKLLTLQGLQSYDPLQGKLRTHLFNQLQGLKRLNRKQTQALHVPERAGLERQGLIEAEQNLTHELGREPSDAEVGEHLGISRQRLLRLRNLHSGLAEGTLEAQPSALGYDVQPLGEHRDLWLDLVYDDSSPIDQKIIEWSGLRGGQALPNHVIARKLRVTPGAVSQRKLQIQQRIDRGDELSPF